MQVREVLRRMREKWMGPEYDLLAHNCCHFCEAFAQELGCKAPPGADSAQVLAYATAMCTLAPLGSYKLPHTPRGVAQGVQTCHSSPDSLAILPQPKLPFDRLTRVIVSLTVSHCQVMLDCDGPQPCWNGIVTYSS